MNRPSWDGRIERAGELAKTYSFASEQLGFYQRIVAFQKDLYAHLDGAAPGSSPDAGWPETLDAGALLPWFSSFLSRVEQVGTAELAQSAARLRHGGEQRWAALLTSYWQGRRDETQNGAATECFFARAYLQPYAEFLAGYRTPTPATARRPQCPMCGAKPQFGVLRPEGYGARRSLVCSLCLTEWDYLRIVCPACGVDVFDDLPVYVASEFEHVRVECCDRCKTYIKTVDLTKNGLAIPVVDELAAIPLDLWAQEHGYAKLLPNLLGF